MTKNLTFKTFAVLVLMVSAGALNARVVVSSAKQNEFLQIARTLLSNSGEPSDPISEMLSDPFHRVKEEVEEPVVEQVVEEVTVAVKEKELTESEILNLVAQKLKPSGFIDQGGQQYLILNGRKVQDGVSFNFPHKDRRYAIEITAIQTHSFTLNLNSESKTISME